MNLATTLTEPIGKKSDLLRCFMQELIDAKTIHAYRVDLNQQTILSETPEERIVRIAKGATFTPIDDIGNEYLKVVLEDTTTQTHYHFHAVDTQIFGEIEEPFEHFLRKGPPPESHYTFLRRLGKDFDKTQAGEAYQYPDGGLHIPEHMITGKLVIDYKVTPREHAEQGSYTLEGETDPLFQRIIQFLKR
ncbi:MAG: hypothetical protein Q7R96_05295 [Nanoarchaeota archaeon]|nr:hypothetical protein [Nanoarchaeota archaeon]